MGVAANHIGSQATGDVAMMVRTMGKAWGARRAGLFLPSGPSLPLGNICCQSFLTASVPVKDWVDL
jgi:hypothetical protein